MQFPRANFVWWRERLIGFTVFACHARYRPVAMIRSEARGIDDFGKEFDHLPLAMVGKKEGLLGRGPI